MQNINTKHGNKIFTTPFCMKILQEFLPQPKNIIFIGGYHFFLLGSLPHSHVFPTKVSLHFQGLEA